MSIRVHDTVWKAVLEDFADDFLRRIFVNADAAFDFSIPIEFLEQELVELQPGAEPEVPKIVDKLLKVHLNDGTERWIRVHVEVQREARRGFDVRMFHYFSHFYKKQDVDVVSIAIFLEKSGKNNLPFFHYDCIGTKLWFEFNCIHLFELDEQELMCSTNAFDKTCLIGRLAINKMSDKERYEQAFVLAKHIHELPIPINKIRRLIDFLCAYIHFGNEELKTKFVKEIELLTRKTKTMGITEFILETAKQQFLQEGMEQGIEKGMEQGMEKGKEAAAETIARNMLQKGVDIRFIQETTSLSLQRLQEIQKNVA